MTRYTRKTTEGWVVNSSIGRLSEASDSVRFHALAYRTSRHAVCNVNESSYSVTSDHHHEPKYVSHPPEMMLNKALLGTSAQPGAAHKILGARLRRSPFSQDPGW